MARGKVNDKYLKWLLDIVEMSDYEAVVDFLYHTPYNFDDTIKFEDNIYENARSLEEEFLPGFSEVKVVSLLEVMVELSRRYYRFTGERTPAYYFRDMLDNLGVYDYPDDGFVPLEVRTTVEAVIQRYYDQFGRRSLFPITGPYVTGLEGTYDATLTDLWKQMNVYWMDKGLMEVK